MRWRPHHWLFGLLMIALIGTQGLGVLHGVLHARGPAAAVASSAPNTDFAVAPAVPHTARGGVWALFDAHHHNGDCELFDQTSHGDQAVALPALAATDGAAWHAPPRWVPHAWAAASVSQFDARAPPARG